MVRSRAVDIMLAFLFAHRILNEMFGIKKNKVEKPQDREKPGLFGRLVGALQKTRNGLVGGVNELFSAGEAEVGEDFYEAIETLLLAGDVGVQATQRIMDELETRMSKVQRATRSVVLQGLQAGMNDILADVTAPLTIEKNRDQPFVILVIGVNGTGKTTTIGKLARRFKDQGLSVMLAAGDTFRAAAVEQLQAWGERNAVPVIAQHSGADAASVVYDGLNAARSRGMDVLIADTAGRLHTQSNLMEELKKIKRVIGKLDSSAPHEVLLVLDSGTGQNALAQADQFNAAVGVTGIVLTKLDGTAKGGIVFSIAEQLDIPIRMIGVGEGAADLRDFDAAEFVNALLML